MLFFPSQLNLPSAFRTIQARNFTGSTASDVCANRCVVKGLRKTQELEKHTGCINTIAWNDGGTKLVSGSDDRSIVVWGGDPLSAVAVIPTVHRNNVFCASFVAQSGDSLFVTCAADGCVHLLNAETGTRRVLHESEGGSFCFKHCMDPSNLAETGLVTMSDGTLVRFDLRTESAVSVLNLRNDMSLRQLSMGRFSAPPSATAIEFNPISPETLGVGTSTKAVILFDVRNLSKCLCKVIPEFTAKPPDPYPGESEAVSGLAWDRRNRLVVNYCRQAVIEMDFSKIACKENEIVTHRVGAPEIPRQWLGRVNHQTFLKEVALFTRERESYVVTGGDCGNLFVWERFGEQRLVLKKPADPFVLNCVAPHPFLPIIATSGIASTASIWSPSFDLRSHDYDSRPSSASELDSVSGYDRVQNACALRAEANELFRARDFPLALSKYIAVCEMLDFNCPDSTVNTERKNCLEKAFSNKAAALMALGRWAEAVEACNAALEICPDSAKTLIRRAKCTLRLERDTTFHL